MPKKEMKKKATPTKVDFGPVRKLFNKVLTKKTNKDLVLVENAHGAVQVKREGNLLFSARKDGKMIITHPIFVGKTKERFCKHSGTKWDHLSNVPFADVTEKMLQDRIADPKTATEYHNEFYKGKKKAQSGLVMKAKAAALRAEKTAKTASKKKNATKSTSKAIRKAVSKKTKKGKAIRKVATSKA